MDKPHRIAAGGIVIHDSSALLVRYMNPDGSSFLVAPGGALEAGENTPQAIFREVREETGVIVQPDKILWIENIDAWQYKMCKIWMLCDVVSPEIHMTSHAEKEGIAEVGWYSRDELENEQVYPSIMHEHHWDEFYSDVWQVGCPPCRDADF